jgi:hypothetical protein
MQVGKGYDTHRGSLVFLVEVRKLFLEVSERGFGSLTLSLNGITTLALDIVLLVLGLPPDEV